MKSKIILPGTLIIFLAWLGPSIGLGRWNFYTDKVSFLTNKLWIRCMDDQKNWSSWMDPFDHLQKSYFSTIANGKGKLIGTYLGLYEILLDEYKALVKECEKSGSCDPMEKVLTTVEHGKVKKLVSDICLSKYQKSEQIQFKLMTFWPKKYSERKLDKRWGRVQEISFPPELVTKNSALTSKEK